MKASANQLAKSLYDAVAANPSKRPEIVEQFLKFLRKRRLKKLLPLVINQLDRIEQEKLGLAQVTIETPRPISPDLRKLIVEMLQKNFGLKRIKENIVINRDIIAGIKLKFGDIVVDGSAKTFYERFASNTN